MSYRKSLWQCIQDLLPVKVFYFDRPLLLLQSDDWGRVGLRDREGMEQLRSAGIKLGERPYDFYTLETYEDVGALSTMLRQHQDSAGRNPCIEMNFIAANLDCQKAADTCELSFLPLANGLPHGWLRPNLFEAYQTGISAGVFVPALHGTSHFCRPAVESALKEAEHAALLRLFWGARTPYIHWRMPWIGYEYWDPGKSPEKQFLDFSTQKKFIGETVGWFARMFSTLPKSACAPGYRANDETHRAWSEHGIRIAQNGPASPAPPYFGRHNLLHLSRTVEFEPATDPEFSIEKCLHQAERCFSLGIPAIVSVHSINFHSTIRNFRSLTLDLLDQFLTALESRHSDLLHLHNENLYEVINKGSYEASCGVVEIKVTQKIARRPTLVAGKS